MNQDALVAFACGKVLLLFGGIALVSAGIYCALRHIAWHYEDIAQAVRKWSIK